MPETAFALRWYRAFGPFLVPLSWPYRVAVVARRRYWRDRAVRLPVPVISVGNITCGGTGKTPTVELVVHELLARGRRPAVVSRGYGAEPRRGASGNDEHRLLAARLPGVPHLQDPDRVRAARRAVLEGADVLVLDDGFQHVRLHRDLDIVLVDAVDPFGGGRLLPAGLLREPLAALRHAGVVVLTRTGLVPAAEAGRLETALRQVSGRPVLQLRTRCLAWCTLEGRERLPPEAFAGRPVVAASGIGNPAAFARQLAALGVEPRAHLVFRDHHRYRPAEVARIVDRARRLGTEAILTTQKDAVKLERARPEPEVVEGLPVLWLDICKELVGERSPWRELLDAVLEPGR